MFSALYTSLLVIATALPALAGPPSLGYDANVPAAKDDADSYLISLTITNKGKDTAKLLTDPRGTLSALPTDAFKIVHDESGKSPDFYGALVKYDPVSAAKIDDADDVFTVLKPGESFTISHDLSKAYDFSASGKGSYTVEPSSLFYYADESGALEVQVPAQKSKITLNSDPTPPEEDADEVDLEGRDLSELDLGELDLEERDLEDRDLEDRDLERRAGYASCSASRRTAIRAAIPAAQSYTLGAYRKLTGNSLRYRTWFGTYNNNRRITVRNHYARIYNTGFNGFTYDCTCTASGTYAYVYANRPTRIYLCGAFWRAPLRGTDSKAGTLVHESSHFTKHGGTRDYAYGQSAARALARRSPAQAIFNADSHEYFAENTPFIG